MLASDITVKFASLFCHYFWYYYLTWRFCGYAGTDISWKSCGLYQRLPTSSHWGQNPTKSVCLEHVMFFNMWFYLRQHSSEAAGRFGGCRWGMLWKSGRGGQMVKCFVSAPTRSIFKGWDPSFTSLLPPHAKQIKRNKELLKVRNASFALLSSKRGLLCGFVVNYIKN